MLSNAIVFITPSELLTKIKITYSAILFEYIVVTILYTLQGLFMRFCSAEFQHKPSLQEMPGGSNKLNYFNGRTYYNAYNNY